MMSKRLQKCLTLAALLLSFFSAKAQVGCPNVNAGPDVTVSCSTPCTTLSATWFDSGQTTNYLAVPIPYTPNPYNVGTPILVNIDDTWSSVINLPFNFCFFGVNYNQVVIGSNGIISFNTTYAGGGCNWMLTGTPGGIPTNTLPTASIMGIYQDIDPTFQGNIYYQLTGTAPCRKLIVSYYHVPYYGDPNSVSTGSCSSPLFATSQIVLYETTNAIDIYTQSKPYCSGWNGGLAIEGIQNAAGTAAVVVPGRNNTVFSTSNDAWRFLPFGASISSFSWLQGTTVLSNLPNLQVCPTVATTYTAQVVYSTCNGNNVTVTDNVTVTPSNAIQVTTAVTQNVTCHNGNNGSLSATPTTGQAPYTYLWSPNAGGSASSSVSGLSPGTYTVTVTDGSGCSSVNSLTLANPPAITSTSAVQNVSCAGGSNGVITITPGGGTAPYNYVWSPSGGTAASTTGLPVGTYTCSITDANGCTGTGTGTLTAPLALSSTIASTNVSCNGGSNGTATVTPSGGTGPYTYNWNTTPSQSAITATGLPAGNYAAIITDSHGCTFQSGSTTITQPAAIVLSATTSPSTCGLSNGSLTASVGGGTAPFSYSLNGGAGQSSTLFSGIPAGNYTVVATDANGCTKSTTAVVGTLATINLQSVNTTPVSCFGGNNGTLTATANGGTGTLTYSINSGPTQTIQTFNSLSAGTYTVVVNDANNCPVSNTVTITQPTQLLLSLTPQTSTCSYSNGSLSATLSGGVSPYSYSLNGGVSQSSNSFTGLPAGSYTITATDNNGCTVSIASAVSNQPAPVIVTTPANNVTCFGGSNGSFSVNITGGTGTILYANNGGAAQTSSTFTGLPLSSNIVIVTDANGCADTATVNISQPSLLTANTSLVQHSCGPNPTGAVSGVAAGGTSPYNYSWSPSGGTGTSANGLAGGNYTYQVTDANGCTASATVQVLQSNLAITLTPTSVTCFGGSDGNISSVVTGNTGTVNYNWLPGGQTTAQISGLTQGSYTLNITDSIGCVKSAVINVTQPPILPVQASAAPAGICVGDQTTLSASGGTGYIWSTGAVTDQTIVSPVATTMYTVTVTDANGCSNSTTVTVPVYPLPIVAFAADTVCKGNVTSFANTSSVTSGSIVQYQWDFGDLVTSSATTPTHFYITAGEFNVSLIATTDHGCIDSISGPVRVWELPNPDFTSDITEGCPPITVNFQDQSTAVDGTVTAYSWIFNNDSTSTNQNPQTTFTNSGYYNITLQATSSLGCVHDTTITNYIHVYDQPIADFSTKPDQPSVYVPNVEFVDESFAAAQWYWDFGDQVVSNLEHPFHAYTFPGTYPVTLIIESPEGCIDSVTKEVTILDEVAVWVPNAFTPNNDGKNDVFFVSGTNISDFSLQIYNRWGQQVFVTDNPSQGWNGRVENQDAKEDVYSYRVAFKTIRNKTQYLDGRISLVR